MLPNSVAAVPALGVSTQSLVQYFRLAAPGTKISLPISGRSLAPLAWSGDVLELEVIPPNRMRRGDVVVVVQNGATLVAHVLVSVAPLRTATFGGVMDPPGGEVVARATAIFRSGTRLPLVALATQLLSFAWSQPAIRRAFRGAPPLRLWRKWRWRVRQVRPLRDSDEANLAQLLADCGVAADERDLTAQLWAQAAEPLALGAFCRTRLVACIAGDRTAPFQCWVHPVVSDLGLESELVRHVLAEARRRMWSAVAANVAPGALALTSALAEAGFRDDAGVWRWTADGPRHDSKQS